MHPEGGASPVDAVGGREAPGSQNMRVTLHRPKKEVWSFKMGRNDSRIVKPFLPPNDPSLRRRHRGSCFLTTAFNSLILSIANIPKAMQ